MVDQKKAKAKKKAKNSKAKDERLNAGDMAAMHVFLRKMTAMQPAQAQFEDDGYKASVIRDMKSDYTTGLAALTEYSRMKKLHEDNPWEKASGNMADAYAPNLLVNLSR